MMRDLIEVDGYKERAPKRARLTQQDFRKLVQDFERLKVELENKLGNTRGRDTLLKNFSLFGLEEGIDTIKKNNRSGVNLIELGIPLCEGLGIPAHLVYMEILKNCVQDVVDRLYTEAKNNKERLLVIQSLMLEYVETRYINRIVLALLDILPKPEDMSPYYPILDDEEAMEFCPQGVKQILWMANPTNFKEYISQVIDRYITDCEMEGQAYEINSPILTIKLKARQEHPAILELVNLIGSHTPLYDIATTMIVELYALHGSVLYCNLRFDLLMAFHRKAIPKITEHDPIFQFVWTLDATVTKDGTMEERIDSLYEAMGNCQKRFVDANYRSFGMILKASFSMDWCSRQFYRIVYNTNRRTLELKKLHDLMEIGFWSRLTAKYGLRYRISDALPQPVEEMVRSLRSLKNLVASHGKISDECMRNIMESMNTSSDDNLYLIIRRTIYSQAKSNAVACSLLGQFVLDRFKSKDYLSLYVVLSVIRQLIHKFEKEKSHVFHVWSAECAPGIPADIPKHIGMSFSEKQGMLDPFLPLLRSFLNVYHLQPERVFELLATRNALHVVMWKFLVVLATQHNPAHEALLHLIIHIQSLIRQHESGSVMHYSTALNTLVEIVESLAASRYNSSNPIVLDDSIHLYRSIRNIQDKFGPDYAFTFSNAPSVLRILGQDATNSLTGP